MNCVFDKVSKKFTGEASRWDMPSILPTEVIIKLAHLPDNTVRINNAMDGVRAATQAEINSDNDKSKDAQVASEFTPAILAVIEALDPVNASVIIVQAKAIRKAEL